MMHLSPCPRCLRHVRPGHACPFCGMPMALACFGDVPVPDAAANSAPVYGGPPVVDLPLPVTAYAPPPMTAAESACAAKGGSMWPDGCRLPTQSLCQRYACDPRKWTPMQGIVYGGGAIVSLVALVAALRFLKEKQP